MSVPRVPIFTLSLGSLMLTRRSKKPHDDTRHRSKQWRPLDVDNVPRTTKMETVAQGASKRVTRTYSKRQSSGPTPIPSQRPVKRQRTESNDSLPSLPPASVAPKAVKKPPSTIDGYFFSSASMSSGTRASDPSSDGGFSGHGETNSPPSSPPARRWTSPRKLKFRPSLLPILGNKRDDEAQTKQLRGREMDDRGGEYGSTAGSLKTERRRQLPGNVGSGNQEIGSTGPVSDEKFCQSGLESKAKRRRKSSAMDEGGKEETELPRRKDDAQRDLTAAPQRRPVYDSQETGATGSATTGLKDDTGGRDTSVPNYTMPYSFYLKAANSEPRSSPPATTSAKKPGRTIQTTLNLSTKQPFKECKLCDTVYNPLHAADVKLHQLRHARLLGEKEEESRHTGRGGRKSV